jgi:hypothetical protein
MAQVFELNCATSKPGASLRASGMQVAPLRRIISFVMTKTAAAERPTVPASFVTDVTGMSIEGTATETLESCEISRSNMFLFVASPLAWLAGA